MFCQNCGKEISANAHFCDCCGAKIANQTAPPVVNEVPQAVAPPKRRSVFTRWWFWLIIVVTILSVVLGLIFGEPTSSDYDRPDISFTFSSQKEETQAQTELVTTGIPSDIEKEFKESCTVIDFDTLARNPDKYKNNNYVFTGEVIQVSEGWFENVSLRINITKKEYEYIDDVLYTDTIYATIKIPEGEDNILEGDIITFWGVCEGEYTYESVIGKNVTLPKISIEYYELVN